MFDEILPRDAAVAVARCDFDAPLYPEEEELIARAADGRRREFITARACARAALSELGFTSQAIRAGPRGDPRWPPGAVGSITHCRGYRAAAVGRAESFLTIGIDAEPHEELPEGILEAITTPLERSWLRRCSADAAETCWDRLLFSIKESVYKACYPLGLDVIGFEDVTIAVDRRQRIFSTRLLASPVNLDGFNRAALSGRWLIRDGLILTAIGLRRAALRSPCA
jgi:4'-phosphopantetheinyl transferase EntD